MWAIPELRRRGIRLRVQRANSWSLCAVKVPSPALLQYEKLVLEVRDPVFNTALGIARARPLRCDEEACPCCWRWCVQTVPPMPLVQPVAHSKAAEAWKLTRDEALVWQDNATILISRATPRANVLLHKGAASQLAASTPTVVTGVSTQRGVARVVQRRAWLVAR